MKKILWTALRVGLENLEFDDSSNSSKLGN